MEKQQFENLLRTPLPHGLFLDSLSTLCLALDFLKHQERFGIRPTLLFTISSKYMFDNFLILWCEFCSQQIRVFRPFFVSLDLPYSVIRDEIVAIPIVVFNYMNKDVEADVTLENEQLDNFEFAEVSNDVNEQPSKCPYGNGSKYYQVGFEILTAGIMENSILFVVQWKETNISEEHIASHLLGQRVSKQETDTKHAASRACCLHGLLFDPEGGSGMFLWNTG